MKERNRKIIIISVIALLVTVAVVYMLNVMKPTTKRRRPAPLVPIVKAIEVKPAKEKIFIEASGEVIPVREVIINTEVEGKITSISGEMIPGGIVKSGDLLVRIDPSEYKLNVNQQKAAVADAASKLDIEKGQQFIARKEWSVFEKEYNAEDSDKRLALRDPQLKSAEAALEAARSRLESSELALAKTTILSPFNAIVMAEFAEKGQFAGRQTQIAQLAGTDRFFVQASVLPEQLPRITFPSKGKKGSEVKIILGRTGGAENIRSGTVHKLLASLDPKGRMARILVQTEDPLNLSGKKGVAKLLLGSFVSLEIEAGTVDNVYVIPREAMSDGERLLILKKDNTLALRETVIEWRRKDDLLIHADIREGERLIVSRLQSPLPGMKLRVKEEESKEIRDVRKAGEDRKRPAR